MLERFPDLIRRYNPDAVRFLGFLITAVILAKLLQRGLFELAQGLTGNANPLKLNTLTIMALVLAFAVWLAWRHSSTLIRLRGFLNAVAACGAFAAGISILWAAILGDRRQDSVPSSTKATRPPIILITIDTLAASHMSLYGYSRETTPALSRMASQSVVFDSHHSNGNFTTSSISSILSGVRPWIHRAFQLGAKPLTNIAREGLLPSMNRAGYRTLAVTTNVFAKADLHRGRHSG